MVAIKVETGVTASLAGKHDLVPQTARSHWSGLLNPLALDSDWLVLRENGTQGVNGEKVS